MHPSPIINTDKKTRRLKRSIIAHGQSIGCLFKFILKVGSEESIVNASQITDPDQVIKSNLTFCVVYVFTLQADEWCVHNRLFNANFEDKFK
jgi:hypothetical protein